ncbi:MFS transporter [Nonomuraea sediminis]|uniref:MFS transporter n=1 Tax=Nonomuraea sediminis TaxID=2835864 RepID=UPI001BDD73D4|nr:MFS transporter [Nonomuraea sediminis]
MTLFNGLPRVFWLLFSGQLVNRFGAVVLPFLVFYLGAKGFSAAEIAGVMSAYGLGGLGGQPLGGYLADRFGRKATLVGGLLATAACLVLIGLAGDLVWLVTGAVALGLVGDVYRPAASAMVAETTPAPQRAKAFGLMHWAINVGAAISGAAAGLLLAHGYWVLVALDAGSSVLFALIVAFGVPAAPPAPRERRAGYAVALRDPALVGSVLIILVGLTIYGQVKYGLPLALAADGLPASLFGLLITLNAGIVVLFQPVAVAWLSRYRRLPVLGISIAVIGAGLALTGVADQAWQYVVTVLIWSAGELGMAAVEAVVIADLTPEGSHGTYQALYGWAAAVSRFAAPALGALLYGSGLLWWSCAALGLACLALSLALLPTFARRAALISS